MADGGSSKLFDPAGRAVAVWNTGSGGYWYLNGIFRQGGRMLGQYKDGITFMVHENALGSTSILTGPAGQVESDFVFFPYGNLWKAGPAYEYHFAGFDFHSGWGMYSTNARPYHWDLGSWVSPDKLGGDVTNPQSLNRYAYVLNNPTTLTDPLGLDACKAGAICVTSWGSAPVDGPGSGLGDLLGGGGIASDFYDMEVLARGPHWGGGGRGTVQTLTQPPSGALTPPQLNTQTDACTEPILSALNNRLDTNFTPTNLARPPFGNGGAINLNIVAGGLPPSQFDAVQTGRYPLHWWSYIIGYGPTLHITGLTRNDPFPAVFETLNVGGANAVLFTAHIDTAFAYNPIGFLIHFLIDKLHIAGPRNKCP